MAKSILSEQKSINLLFSVCGEVDALRALLANGADITKTDLNGGSPVWMTV